MTIILDGTTGITTPTTSTTGEFVTSVTGFKNRIINGQLNVNQRGVSGTVTLTAGSYGHDRFKGGASGCTYTFATSNNVTTLTISAGSLIQVVEGLNLESGTYTLSFTGTAQGKIGAGSFSASGVTGSITGGTNTNIEFNTGTLSLPQLEKGSTATSFDYRPYGTELALCQRYYEKSYNQDVVPGVASFTPGFASSTASSAAPTQANGCTFKVTKRANPTCVSYNAVTGASGSAYRVSDGANVAVTLTSIGYSGVGYLDFASSSNGYYWHFTASAEL